MTQDKKCNSSPDDSLTVQDNLQRRIHLLNSACTALFYLKAFDVGNLRPNHIDVSFKMQVGNQCNSKNLFEIRTIAAKCCHWQVSSSHFIVICLFLQHIWSSFLMRAWMELLTHTSTKAHLWFWCTHCKKKQVWHCSRLHRLLNQPPF